jgi:recombinational DNA repair protein RecR
MQKVKVMIVGGGGLAQKLAIEKALITENKVPIFISSVDEIPEDKSGCTESTKFSPEDFKQICTSTEKRKGHERPYKFHR